LAPYEDLEKRRGFYKQVLEVEPYVAKTHHGLALLLSRQQRYGEAILHEKLALELPVNPNIAFSQAIEVHRGLAYMLAATGKTEEAEVHYRQSLAAYEDAKSRGFGLLMEANTGDYKPLLTFIEGAKAQQSLKLNPNDALAHARLGKQFSQQGEPEKAVEQFKKATELNPNIPVCEVNFCQ